MEKNIDKTLPPNGIYLLHPTGPRLKTFELWRWTIYEIHIARNWAPGGAGWEHIKTQGGTLIRHNTWYRGMRELVAPHTPSQCRSTFIQWCFYLSRSMMYEAVPCEIFVGSMFLHDQVSISLTVLLLGWLGVRVVDLSGTQTWHERSDRWAECQKHIYWSLSMTDDYLIPLVISGYRLTPSLGQVTIMMYGIIVARLLWLSHLEFWPLFNCSSCVHIDLHPIENTI